MSDIRLKNEERKIIVESIKEFYLKERDEEISDLSAGFLLDFIIERIGPYLYNQGIRDAHRFMNEKVEDLFGLEKRVR
ncbi:MAG TPA: DUF2164 domain-containing protein [Methylomusa anaerophila]|uniref:DUF2164 domain-containing protein n=1 Tax=Methylomusa anaerophila TaxID=1930071 RepID=A0A348AJE0_9FIRM|nr:DUF2164 domain-containing protein [Methylomusa anaerophila]BBB91188.1 hypothetical protein MAMMFC1_01859 [Methylomusa anaerophila]HML89065.1 DUF2164 domain-containing protein [Methylomusa anaerophila]